MLYVMSRGIVRMYMYLNVILLYFFVFFLVLLSLYLFFMMMLYGSNDFGVEGCMWMFIIVVIFYSLIKIFIIWELRII